MFKQPELRLDEHIKLIAHNKILSPDAKLCANGRRELANLQAKEMACFEQAVRASKTSLTLAESFLQTPLINIYEKLIKEVGGEDQIPIKNRLFLGYFFPCHQTAEIIAGGARAIGAEFVTFHSNPNWSIEYSAALSQATAIKKLEENPNRENELKARILVNEFSKGFMAIIEQKFAGNKNISNKPEVSNEVHPYRLETEGVELVRQQLRPMTEIFDSTYPGIIGHFMHSGDFYGMHFEDSPTPTDLRFRVDPSFVDQCADGHCYLH